MEVLSAHWDSNSKTFVAAAQDNSVQIGPSGCEIGSGCAVRPSVGFIMGDGTITAVDSTQSPSRIFGACQFMGSTVDKNGVGDDDDTGLKFVEG